MATALKRNHWLIQTGTLFHGDGAPVDVEFDLVVTPAIRGEGLGTERGLGRIRSAIHADLAGLLATKRRIVLHADGLMVRIKLGENSGFTTIGLITRKITGSAFVQPTNDLSQMRTP
jgi:hypothetical protein